MRKLRHSSREILGQVRALRGDEGLERHLVVGMRKLGIWGCRLSRLEEKGDQAGEINLGVCKKRSGLKRRSDWP